ncbi:NAD(P)/FAD-dependent oxidoreductase [Kordiimonas aquimaris]|uniref:NAD(P)/FAD-dependent oxidoreductase n=1 Tax=Kordiimonas aquimaris TaxID=707591 RepID=UPI0021D20BD4|nr:FAD-binding oxidoreductase [Kordiimonas aquimaris]
MRIRDSIHTDRLPLSYYAASNNYPEAFPRLEGNVESEVCVIGGGFTGVSTALHLAEKGVDVVLVEQNQIGWGASGRNGGQVLGGFGPELSDYEEYEKVYGVDAALKVWQLGVDCVDIVRDWIVRYGIDCDFAWGYFDAAMNEREFIELKAAKEALEKRGYPHDLKLVSSREINEVIGSDRFIGGLVNEGWGHCHPLNLVRGEAKAAEKLGARIYEDARVSDIKYEADSITVDLTWCRVSAKKVVLAGNAYLGNLVPELERQVLPVGSYIIATEPLPADVIARILPGNHAACDQRWALDYFRLSADGRLLFGGMANYNGTHPKKIKDALYPKMIKVFPELEGVRIDFEWGGNLGVGLNRIPQIGRLDDVTYYAQAYAGHGVAQTHMAGRIIADAIRGEDEMLSIMETVKHRAFPGGRLFRTPLLAAGMAFEQFKETIRNIVS